MSEILTLDEIKKKLNISLLHTDWRNDADEPEELLDDLFVEFNLAREDFHDNLYDFFADLTSFSIKCQLGEAKEAADHWLDVSAHHLKALLEALETGREASDLEEENLRLEDRINEMEDLEDLEPFSPYRKNTEEAIAILEETLDLDITLDDLRRGIELVKAEKEEKRKEDMKKYQAEILDQKKEK